MLQDNFESVRVFVFKHVLVNDFNYFMHFGCDAAKKLVPVSLLTECEHEELLAYE